MLFVIDTEARTGREVQLQSFVKLPYNERYDIQEWILSEPRILGEELLVITSEFSGFDRTSERLDILALDRQGRLVVVELKRSAVGTAAELQGLRYAAYCSTMELSDVAELLCKWVSNKGNRDIGVEEASHIIRDCVNDPDYSELGDNPRLILGAEEFSTEITATVLWLRSFGVDISCVRIWPYMIENQLVLESCVLIPLPEAGDYQIRRERKDAAQALRQREILDAEDFVARVPESIRPLLQRFRTLLTQMPGVTERAFESLLSYRWTEDREWLSWLQYTKSEVRVGLPPDVPLDSELFVRTTPGGWSVARVRSTSDAEHVEQLFALMIESRSSASSDGTPVQPSNT